MNRFVCDVIVILGRVSWKNSYFFRFSSYSPARFKNSFSIILFDRFVWTRAGTPKSCWNDNFAPIATFIFDLPEVIWIRSIRNVQLIDRSFIHSPFVPLYISFSPLLPALLLLFCCLLRSGLRHRIRKFLPIRLHLIFILFSGTSCFWLQNKKSNFFSNRHYSSQ